MTKNPLLLAILLTLLTACMSSPEGAPTPQVTPPLSPSQGAPALGEGTGVRETPPPTETPLPTLTPTPVAVDGIAEDADGNQLAYLNGEWLVVPTLDADYAKLMVDGDNVVAVDGDGEVVFEYDRAAHNWVEVEKTYPSCAMPELIAEQDAGFTERTGRDLNDVEHPFIQAVNKITSVGWRPEMSDIVDFTFVKTGYGEVAMNHPEIDSLVCLYGRNGVVPGETMAFVMGWMDKSGNYHPLTLFTDSVTGQDLSQPWPLRGGKTFERSDQLAAMKNMPDGSLLSFAAQTFSGRSAVSEVQSKDTWHTVNLDGVRRLLSLLGGDVLVKQWGEAGRGNVAEYWRNLTPESGNPGYLPGQTVIFKDMLDLATGAKKG